MFVKETLEIIEKLMKQCGVSDFKVSLASTWVHDKNGDNEELARNQSKEVQWEYDIVLTGVVSHWELQRIDEILSEYENVEMRVQTEGLRIFEREA